jgi:hypothetical protein
LLSKHEIDLHLLQNMSEKIVKTGSLFCPKAHQINYIQTIHNS